MDIVKMKKIIAILVIFVLILMVVRLYQSPKEKLYVTSTESVKTTNQVTQPTDETTLKNKHIKNISQNPLEKTIEQPCLTEEELNKYWEEKNKVVNKFLLQSDLSEVQQMMAIVGSQNTTINSDSTEKDREKSINDRIDELSKALDDYPDNKLINYQFMGICSMNPDNANCSVANIAKSFPKP